MKLLLCLLFCLGNRLFASEYVELDVFEGPEEYPGYILDYVSRPYDDNRKIDKNGNTYLMRVCCYGTYDELLQLLKKNDEVKNDINCPNDFGDTLLGFMCEFGSVEKVELLLQYGAHVSQRNSMSCTPLMLACTSCCLEKVRLLLKHGAHINAIKVSNNGSRLTPLFLFVKNCHKNVSLPEQCNFVKEMIYNGANLNLGKYLGALDTYHNLLGYSVVYGCNLALIELLLENNINQKQALQSTSDDKYCNLYHAVKYGIPHRYSQRSEILALLKKYHYPFILECESDNCCSIL